MAAQKLDTEIRQEQIAQAALSLIAAQGLKGLSVAAVARRVGLVPSAIYRHFKGKEQMLEAVLQYVRSRIFENFEAVCHEEADSIRRLERVVFYNVQMARELQAMPRIIFSEGLYTIYPGVRRRAYEVLKGYLGKIEELVREGQRQGRIRAELDPGSLAVMVWGLLPPAVILLQLSEGRFDVTRHAKRAWQIFREAIELPALPQNYPRIFGSSSESSDRRRHQYPCECGRDEDAMELRSRWVRYKINRAHSCVCYRSVEN